MRSAPWWIWALMGASFPIVVTIRKHISDLPAVIAGEEDLVEFLGMLAGLAVIGAGGGLLIWVGLGLSRRYGVVGDGLIGMIVLPYSVAAVVLLIYPGIISDRALLLALLTTGLPVLVLLLIGGFSLGVWFGHNVPKNNNEEMPEVEDVDLPFEG